MDKPKILVVSMVKNEDLYIKRVVENVIDFCDEMIILDNMSTDGTYEILEKLDKENEKIKLHRIKNFKQSGSFTKPYINTNTFILSVDGDELYDKKGLVKMRKDILANKFQDKWTISGYFLNCTSVDWENNKAEGHMSPPSRACVRLYNFKAIHTWVQRRQRMHGGKPRFNRGYNLESRYTMHEHLTWDKAYLRFLHLCFVQRSSLDTQ